MEICFLLNILNSYNVIITIPLTKRLNYIFWDLVLDNAQFSVIS